MSCTRCKSVFQSKDMLVYCKHCIRYFCLNCIEHDGTQCSTCAILNKGLIKRSTLKKLGTTDMFAYLRCREVFTHNITTREELYKEVLLHVGTPPPHQVVKASPIYSQDYTNLYETFLIANDLDMQSDELLHLFGLHVIPIDVNTLHSSLASAPYLWELESSFGSVKPGGVVSDYGAMFAARTTLFASAIKVKATKKFTRKSMASRNETSLPLIETSLGEETNHEKNLDEEVDVVGEYSNQTCNLQNM